MKARKTNRLAALFLSLCMAVGMLPMTAFAEGQTGLCAHHPEHTAECGYAEDRPCGYSCNLCGKADNGPEDAGTITVTAFDALEGAVKQVPFNTTWDGLNLPATLGASGYRVSADTSILPEPEAISVEGVTWEVFEREGSPAAYEEDRPTPCIYWLRAVLPERYALDEGAVLPEIAVRYGMVSRTAKSATVGAFTVTGDAAKYDWSDPVLTIKDGATLTIQNTNPNTSTQHRIKVAENATGVSLTLAGVNIAVSSVGACAFDMSGATVTLTLAEDSSNIFISGGNHAGLHVPEGAKLTIQGDGKLVASSSNGAGIGGRGSDGNGGDGGNVTIGGNAQVEVTSTIGAGIGGGSGSGRSGKGGNGSEVTIEGSAKVTATSVDGAGIGGGRGDIGGDGGNGGSLSVTGGATLKMQNNSTNVDFPGYNNCTIIDKNGNGMEYNDAGKGTPVAFPTLTLSVDPADSQIFPGDVTLTAILSGAYKGILSGKTITFTGSGTHTGTTDDSGKATYTFTSLSPGIYTFGASFNRDTNNKPATADSISGYTVSRGTQGTLSLTGLDSTYTYGDEPFDLSTSGGSGNGAVSYVSSDSSVASVTGSRVTIRRAGTFTITATKAGDDNYVEAEASGMAKVSEATPGVSLTATGGADINDPMWTQERAQAALSSPASATIPAQRQ